MGRPQDATEGRRRPQAGIDFGIHFGVRFGVWPGARFGVWPGARFGVWPAAGAAVARLAGAGILAAVASGCAAPEPPRLIALLGCGLQDPAAGDEEEAAFTALRVQARGDFPPDDDDELRLSSGRGTLNADPSAVAGVTVEGLIGDSVTAVGRTARMSERGDISVYFAPVDQWCAVTSAVGFREAAALAVGPMGDVLVVGGRDPDGRIIDDVVRLRDDTDVAITLSDVLPVPSTGHSVHAVGPRSFVVVGGAGVNPTAMSSLVHIDLQESGAIVGDPDPIELPIGIAASRAYHGAAPLPDGRILVAGGCTGLGLASECIASDVNVLASSFTIAFDDHADAVFEPAAPLATARYGHQLWVARDGVVFAAGGRNAFDAPVHQPERLLVDGEAFEPYGPENLTAFNDPDSSCAPDLAPDPALIVESSALFEGGLIVLAFSDGTLRWVTETETGCFRQWCRDDGPCFDRPPPSGGMAPPSTGPPRSILALPGERILADGFLLPVASVGRTGADAVDLSMPTIDNPIPPPGQRTGAGMLVLDDGSVLVASGRDPRSGEPAQPFFVRLRPELDGPDERVPDVDGLSAGSLIALQPDRVLLTDDGVRFLSAGIGEDFPSVRARARGFRSASFRFEVTLQTTSTEPHIVLEQGAVAGISLRLQSTSVRAVIRDATGTATEISCGAADLDFTDPQVMRIDVRPGSIVVRRGGEEIAHCVGPGDVPVAVGIGASGSGTLTASQMRLTRI